MTDSIAPNSVAPSASDFELTLSQIKGLYASRVVLDQQRALSEIHVVASAARKPKQVVRDIETLLFVKHGVKIDYRKISLVFLDDAQFLRVPVARPEIHEVLEESLGNQRRIRVKIQGGGKIVFGEANEPIDNPVPFHTAANATIDGIEKLTGHYLDVRLENAATMRLESREILLIVLACLIEGREETFVGASFVGTRVHESAARATLDALNRRIYSLSGDTGRQWMRPQ
ncbi:MAG: hypothetical protein HY070_02160 [Chloroflexi bacterium]|nr:hypothetical protein [Chloroflexota bacterium]